MTFDQYSNCAFGCLYCFSQFRRAIGGGKDGYVAGDVKAVNVEKIKALFRGELEPPADGNVNTSGLWQFGDYVKRGMTLQWGGLSDPFCPYEKKHGVGLELLRFFRDIEYQVSFSTKGIWWLDDDRYMSCFDGNPNFNVKMSIITDSAAKSRAIETGVASPKKRLKAIERLAKVMPGDGALVLRFRPFIIGVSNPGHKQLIKDAANAGATAVSTEFFCVETRATKYVLDRYKRIGDITGYDVLRFYKHNSRGAGYLRLNRAIKKRYVDEMEQACRESGIRFYVSDAHYKERSDGGCCCGLPPSWRYSRGQLLQAVQIAKENGSVSWSDVAPELHYAETFGFARAQGYNSQSEERRAMFKGRTMADFLRWNWNTPNNGQSPYKFYGGVLRPERVDDNGDVVYQYSEETAGR
jgi:DNA repair photolyase